MVFEPRKDALAAIVLAVAGCESFINELTSSCESAVGLSGQLGEFSRTLPALEEARASVKTKFGTAVSILYGQKADFGGPPLQDFATLIGLRNELAHSKDLSVVVVDVPSPTTDVPPYASRLLSRSAATQYTHLRNYHWMRRLMRRWVADWACDSAFHACQHILNAISDPKICEPYRSELAATLQG